MGDVFQLSKGRLVTRYGHGDLLQPGTGGLILGVVIAIFYNRAEEVLQQGVVIVFFYNQAGRFC